MRNDVYSEKGLDAIFTDDGLSAGEYGFMRGYINAV